MGNFQSADTAGGTMGQSGSIRHLTHTVASLNISTLLLWPILVSPSMNRESQQAFGPDRTIIQEKEVLENRASRSPPPIHSIRCELPSHGTYDSYFPAMGCYETTRADGLYIPERHITLLITWEIVKGH